MATREEIRKRPNYVDNKKFLEAMIEFGESVQKAQGNGEPRPQVPYYIAECIMKIATHLSYKPNFMNYSFRDDMISDGIENSLQYIDNFNPEKSKNPFAYFTQIIYYAFLRRIQKEKKQSHVKNKIIENMTVDESLIDDNDMGNPFVDYLQKNFLPDEDVYKPKKKAVKPKGLELFYNEDSTDN